MLSKLQRIALLGPFFPLPAPEGQEPLPAPFDANFGEALSGGGCGLVEELCPTGADGEETFFDTESTKAVALSGETSVMLSWSEHTRPSFSSFAARAASTAAVI